MTGTRVPHGASIERASRLLGRAERLGSLVLLVAVFALMAAQVIARYGFGRPIPWSEELARLALIWLTFMAAAFVMADGRHIAVDVVSRPMGPRGRVALECAGTLVVLAVSATLVPAGLQFAGQMGQVRSPALQLPIAWWYLAAVAGFALLGLHAALNLALAFLRGTPVWDDRDDGRTAPGVIS